MRRKIAAFLQEAGSPFGAVGVGIVRRKHEEILTDFFDHSAKERFVAFAAKIDPAGLEIVARRMADQIFGAVTGIFEMVVHALNMRRHPTDAALKKRKFEILVAIQQTGT